MSHEDFLYKLLKYNRKSLLHSFDDNTHCYRISGDNSYIQYNKPSLYFRLKRIVFNDKSVMYYLAVYYTNKNQNEKCVYDDILNNFHWKMLAPYFSAMSKANKG
jgi:hypothetical protein